MLEAVIFSRADYKDLLFRQFFRIYCKIVRVPQCTVRGYSLQLKLGLLKTVSAGSGEVAEWSKAAVLKTVEGL